MKNKINLDFAFDFQELSQNNNFYSAIRNTVKDYMDRIDTKKTSDDTLVFFDNSACKFNGHSIELIEEYER